MFKGRGISRRCGDERGMTLLELLTVVAIIGIGLAIAIPAYISYLPHIRLRAAARDIASSLNAARMWAVANNSNATLIFDTTSDTYTSSFNPIYGSANRDWVGKVDIWDPTPSGKYNWEYIENNLGAVDGKVTYGSNGVPSNLGTAPYYAIYLKNSAGEEYRVLIDPLTGTVQVQFWNNVNNWDDE